MKYKRIAVLFAVVAVLGLCLTSCIRINGNGVSMYRYDDSGKYSAGDFEIPASKIRKVEIDWVSGSVLLESGGGSAVSVRESCRDSLDQDELLRWRLDGSKLVIKFQKSGIAVGKSHAKDLVVRLPKGFVMDELDIGLVSADATVAVDSREYDISTVSGDVEIDSSVEAEADLKTVSGDLTMNLGSSPSDIDIESVSGSAYLNIPASSGFTAEISSVSGTLNSSIPVTKSGKRYVHGDGRGEISFSSVSGNLNINSL